MKRQSGEKRWGTGSHCHGALHTISYNIYNHLRRRNYTHFTDLETEVQLALMRCQACPGGFMECPEVCCLQTPPPGGTGPVVDVWIQD